jgi:DNA-binding CsgD family transcriptional regulator
VPVPIILLLGDLADARATAEGLGGGWTPFRGWDLDSEPWSLVDRRLVVWGEVRGEEDARRALLAGTRGAGVVASIGERGRLLEQLFEDLRRLGPVDYRDGTAGSLDEEDERLLELLRAGHSQAQAAEALHYSSRTVKRRMARIRRTLGVDTTVEALLAAPPARSRP